MATTPKEPNVQLIGMLDSPYVRRTAISLRLLGVSFEHRPMSVFRHFEEFSKINPVVKAPTLVCDDGTVLIDSTLILDYAERLCGKSLMPSALPQRQRALRLVGLALAACEKTVQVVYERTLRPPEKQHEPWFARVRGQVSAAYATLEGEVSRAALECTSGSITQAGVTVAVAWSFTQLKIPEIVAAAEYPALRDFAARAEQLPEFLATPIT
jgi:glutathione S-transferase